MTTIATEARIRPVGMELRAVETTDSLSMLSGIAVPYGERADIGWYLEEHAPGSLAKSITEAARGLPLHLFHDDRSFPIGVSNEWHEEAGGLRGVWKLDESPEAKRAAQLAKPDDEGRSALGYMSIRFQPIRSDWTYVEDWNPDLGPEHKDAVIRRESRLVEVSLVSTPAFRGASVTWVRTGERPATREAAGAPPRAVRAWREYADSLKGK